MIHDPRFVYDPRLIVEPGFWDLTPEMVGEVSNGCGAKGKIDLVPDCILGRDIWLACTIHDYAYSICRDKEDADRAFLYNLLVSCDTDNIFRYLSRARIAFMYFEAVVGFGGGSYGVTS